MQNFFSKTRRFVTDDQASAAVQVAVFLELAAVVVLTFLASVQFGA